MRWTLPNILTLARICLTPVIALLPFIQGYWPKVIAFLIFLAASASDVVDGYLARRRNEVSELGQLLDPIADKLLLFATLIPIFWLTRHPTATARCSKAAREPRTRHHRHGAAARVHRGLERRRAGPRPGRGGCRDHPPRHSRRSAGRDPRGRGRGAGTHWLLGDDRRSWP